MNKIKLATVYNELILLSKIADNHKFINHLKSFHHRKSQYKKFTLGYTKIDSLQHQFQRLNLTIQLILQHSLCLKAVFEVNLSFNNTNCLIKKLQYKKYVYTIIVIGQIKLEETKIVFTDTITKEHKY